MKDVLANFAKTNWHWVNDNQVKLLAQPHQILYFDQKAFSFVAYQDDLNSMIKVNLDFTDSSFLLENDWQFVQVVFEIKDFKAASYESKRLQQANLSFEEQMSSGFMGESLID